MSGYYNIPFAYTGNANVDLLEVNVASTKPVLVLGYDIQQTSDVGDAAEEILALLLKTGATTSGSGGSASTPVNLDRSGAAASLTAEQANTTKASAGTIVTVLTLGWNIRQPDRVIFTQEQQILLPASARLTFEIPAATDSLTITGQMYVWEIG